MGKRNTAIKTCHRCKKLVPTATRYCRCGYDFKTAGTNKGETPTPPPSTPTTPTPPEPATRKSERRQRITVKPDFYSPSDYENPFKKQRKRTVSDTTSVNGDVDAKKKRGRPIVKPQITKPIPSTSVSSALSEDSSGTPNADSTVVKKESESFDMYATIPPEKLLQYRILVAEINNKIGRQWNQQ